MWKMIYRTSFVKLFICVIFIYFLVDNDKNVEVKKELKEEPMDEDVVNVETFDDDPMIIDKPQVQEMFDVQKRKTENLLVNSIKKVRDGSNDDVIKNATNISNIIFDYEYNIPIKKEIKQEIKNEPTDEDVEFDSYKKRNAHKRKIEKNFSCDKCGLFFNQKQDLVKHIKEIHQGKRSFKCRQCDKIFGYVSHLNRHIDTVHLKSK